MTQKTFANLLKAVIVLALFCCAVVYVLYVPAIAREAADNYAEFSALYVPALVFIELTALPILAALVLAWQIAHAVGQDNSFCRANASRMKAISLLALADVVIENNVSEEALRAAVRRAVSDLKRKGRGR